MISKKLLTSFICVNSVFLTKCEEITIDAENIDINECEEITIDEKNKKINLPKSGLTIDKFKSSITFISSGIRW